MKYSIFPLFLLLFLLVACSEKEVAPVAEAIRPVQYAKVIKVGAGASQYIFRELLSLANRQI